MLPEPGSWGVSSSRAQAGGHSWGASSCQLLPGFIGTEWRCDGNRQRAGANNWDISGQRGPIVASSCHGCLPLLLLFVLLPPRRPASRPQCVFLALPVLRHDLEMSI